MCGRLGLAATDGDGVWKDVVKRLKWHTESEDGTAPERTKTPLKA